MKKCFQIVISLLFVTTLFSCQKLNEAEIEVLTFKNSLNLLSNVLENRFQLIGASLIDDNCYLAFSNGSTVRLSREVFPILKTSEHKYWSISGHTTYIPIQYDDYGNIKTPTISIGESKFWIIDDGMTSMSAERYLSCMEEMGIKERTLKGLLLLQDKSVFIFSDNTSYSLSLIQDESFVVPSYYMKHLKEKELLTERSISEANDNCTSFIFFTDTHWDNNYKHSPALIRHINDYSGISKVFFGGDVIYKHASTPQDALQEGLDFQKAFNFLGPNFYCVYGNHDNNSEGQVNKTDQHLNEEQVISYLQSQMTVLDKKEGYNFYFDEPRSKTRFIGLDTGRYYRSQFRTNFTKTASFLIEALQKVPEEWHIVVISHIFMATTKVDGENKVVFATYCDFPLSIMDMYNMRQSGRSTYKKEYVDFDFTNCKGHIVFCIGGHVHTDELLFTEGGIPVVSVPTDSKNVSNKEEVKKGTISEQSVSIITIDYSSRKINLFSVGRGIDREIIY